MLERLFRTKKLDIFLISFLVICLPCDHLLKSCLINLKYKKSRTVVKEPLIVLLQIYGAPYLRKYIEKYVSPSDVGILYDYYSEKHSELTSLIYDLPRDYKEHKFLTVSGYMFSFVSSSPEDTERKEI